MDIILNEQDEKSKFYWNIHYPLMFSLAILAFSHALENLCKMVYSPNSPNGTKHKILEFLNV